MCSNSLRITIFEQTFLTLDYRTNMSDSDYMNGNELLKKLKGLGKQRGVTVAIEKHHGKGSQHCILVTNARP